MEFDQIDAVFGYLVGHSPDRQLLVGRLRQSAVPYDPVAAITYLPMYSIGVGENAITPRIDWLRGHGWTPERLSDADLVDVRTIADGRLPNGQRFGMEERIQQLMQRAREIRAYGHVQLRTTLAAPAAPWGCRDLLDTIRLLKRFHRVGIAASLHILMELNWGVVKPDRHICRFLSRLGGRWATFFERPGVDKIDDYSLLPLLEEWRVACATVIAAHRDRRARGQKNGLLELEDLVPRQIDFLIMGYTQSVGGDARAWRAEPVCTADPNCARCHMPRCGKTAPANHQQG